MKDILVYFLPIFLKFFWQIQKLIRDVIFIFIFSPSQAVGFLFSKSMPSARVWFGNQYCREPKMRGLNEENCKEIRIWLFSSSPFFASLCFQIEAGNGNCRNNSGHISSSCFLRGLFLHRAKRKREAGGIFSNCSNFPALTSHFVLKPLSYWLPL